jgi:hypothetical protein
MVFACTCDCFGCPALLIICGRDTQDRQTRSLPVTEKRTTEFEVYSLGRPAIVALTFIDDLCIRSATLVPDRIECKRFLEIIFICNFDSGLIDDAPTPTDDGTAFLWQLFSLFVCSSFWSTFVCLTSSKRESPAPSSSSLVDC